MVSPGVTIRKPRVELAAARAAHGVDGLPRDQHRHHRGLASAGGQLECQSAQARVGILVGVGQVQGEARGRFAELRRHLGEPDCRLGSLDLAEERPRIAEGVVAPVLKESRRFERDAPVVRVRQRAPLVHLGPHGVDHGGVVVLLLLGRPLVEQQRRLLVSALALLGRRHRHHEVGPAAAFDDALRRLLVGAKLPVARRVLVGRVEDRSLEEGVGHAPSCLSATACSRDRSSSSCTHRLLSLMSITPHFVVLRACCARPTCS